LILHNPKDNITSFWSFGLLIKLLTCVIFILAILISR
jgi:hypothetical protein